MFKPQKLIMATNQHIRIAQTLLVSTIYAELQPRVREIVTAIYPKTYEAPRN